MSARTNKPLAHTTLINLVSLNPCQCDTVSPTQWVTIQATPVDSMDAVVHAQIHLYSARELLPMNIPMNQTTRP